MKPTTVERLSRVEFEQLSTDEQSEHVQDALMALRKSIPHSAADAGAFIDVRLSSKSSSNGRRRKSNSCGRSIALE